jgi:hypothetical protein
VGKNALLFASRLSSAPFFLSLLPEMIEPSALYGCMQTADEVFVHGG